MTVNKRCLLPVDMWFEWYAACISMFPQSFVWLKIKSSNRPILGNNLKIPSTWLLLTREALISAFQ